MNSIRSDGSGELHDSGEFDFISSIRKSLPPLTDVLKEIGDDAAGICLLGEKKLKLAAGLLSGGVHFDLSRTSAHYLE